MSQTGWNPARMARWGGVLLGALLFACGPAPEGDPAAQQSTVDDPAVEDALPLAPDEKSVDLKQATGRSSGVSSPFDVSRPSLKKQPTGRSGEGVAFDGENYFVVWEDERSGEVFGARVTPSGMILDPAGIPLNLGTGLAGAEPRVAWDGKQFVVVWVNGNDGVFGAHVGSDGDVRRHFVFITSDEVFGPPGIACARGVCLVAYVVSGDAEDVIVFDRVESDGDVVDGEALSVIPGFAFRPAVAWNGKEFLVVWEDERGGADSEDIFGARVKKDGTVRDPGGVPLIALPGAQGAADVVWTGDRYLLVWQDDRGGTLDIFGARLRGDLTVSGPVGFPISNGPGDQAFPRVAHSGSKSLVVWDDTRTGHNRVRGARVGDDGSVWDPGGFKISSGNEEEERLPAVAAGDHQFFVAFAGADTGAPMFELHHIRGTRVQHDKTVKDSPALLFTRSAYLQEDVAAASGADSSLVVWREVREGLPRLMATRVRPDGRVLGSPITLTTEDARNPSVAWNGDVWLVVWQEGPFGSGVDDVRGARVSAGGAVLDPGGFDIAALPGGQFDPSVASNLDDFFVVWLERRMGLEDVFGTRVSAGGAVLDPGGFQVSPVDAFDQDNPSVIGISGGRYLVTWIHLDFITHPIDSERSVRGTRVDADGTVLDVPDILIGEGPAFFAPPALAYDGTNALVAWTSAPIGSSSPGPAVLAARVDGDGTVLDTPPIAVATSTDRDRTHVTATFDGTDFWLAWQQTLATPFFPVLEFNLDVYGARVRTSGTVRDPGGRPIATHRPEPEFGPALVSGGGERATVFYTEFVTEEDVMNLRIQGRVLTGLGASSMDVAAPKPEAAR
ncbi:hypothetical protein P2318_10580 [Myxococcaceae bacterium GXIMD 01537]